jgi:hypothetical protein
MRYVHRGYGSKFKHDIFQNVAKVKIYKLLIDV